MFCAPTLMLCEAPSASITFAIAVNGGTITTSTSVMSPRSSNNDWTKRADSACVMFIFQLAATIFFLMSSIHHEDHEGHEERRKSNRSFVLFASFVVIYSSKLQRPVVPSPPEVPTTL